MNRKTRLEVYEKYGGRCAYCGKKIAFKDMQVDHIVPLYRGWSDKALGDMKRGADDISNYNPSCRQCNFKKSLNDLETFRKELRKQASCIVRRSFQVRQSIDYGLIEYKDKPIEFYFEKFEREHSDKEK